MLASFFKSIRFFFMSTIFFSALAYLFQVNTRSWSSQHLVLFSSLHIVFKSTLVYYLNSILFRKDNFPFASQHVSFSSHFFLFQVNTCIFFFFYNCSFFFNTSFCKHLFLQTLVLLTQHQLLKLIFIFVFYLFSEDLICIMLCYVLFDKRWLVNNDWIDQTMVNIDWSIE